MNLALLASAALAFAVGGVFMKQSAGLTRLAPSLALFVLFAAGAALQSLAMRHSEMGVSYVFVLGLEALLAFAFSALFFHEHAGAARIAGVLLVAVGIALLRS